LNRLDASPLIPFVNSKRSEDRAWWGEIGVPGAS
jgi:hypothetical protein